MCIRDSSKLESSVLSCMSIDITKNIVDTDGKSKKEDINRIINQFFMIRYKIIVQFICKFLSTKLLIFNYLFINSHNKLNKIEV